MNSDKRPARWAPSNWPVRVKVLAIVVVPLVLAAVFGGLRVYGAATDATGLRAAAQRAQVVPTVSDYMAALENAMVTATDGGDTAAAFAAFATAQSALREKLDATAVSDDVRLAANTLTDYGQNLVDRIAANDIDLRTRVMTYAPLLITAETAITGLVGTDDQRARAEADVLSRAVGARGQMVMQRMLVTRGAELPEPALRAAMVTLAGTEPAAVTTLGAYLGGTSQDASALRSEMVARMSVLSDPASALVGNPDLLSSQQITTGIADRLIEETSADIPATVSGQADAATTAAIRDAALTAAAVLVALALVTLVARSLVRPLRTLRDGALTVAHVDLPREVDRVRADGKEFTVTPIAVHTTEEIGQVAHAVDELHQQAVVLAGEQARLQMQVTDMFETLSRRNRSLVDQQLTLIDHLERDEEDPDRLQSLFRLDHLAARMRRNGANLMVLAGAAMSREQASPVPVATLVNAAASEVEDYTRVTVSGLPDSEVDGAVAGDLVHILAELLDNALRYSPPSAQVHVSAVSTGNNGLVIEVADTGLGMTESDLRVANTRLESGGEVNPYTARHMGLFVAGRLAAAHGLVVRLRSTTSGRADSGTTAGVYVPARLLRAPAPPAPVVRPAEAAAPRASHARSEPAPIPMPPVPISPALVAPVPADDRLPRRRPGASGIAGGSAAGEIAGEVADAGRPVRSDVSAFFAGREAAARETPETPAGETPPGETPALAARESEAPRAGHAPVGDDDAIYQKMLSEWLVDPHELSQSTDLNWKSVWDHGWSAAEAVEAAPVGDRTAEGLPVRRPGARLIPGHADEPPVGGEPARDPEAVRASIGNHFGGVQAGRRRAQDSGGPQ